jgi:hypothetical protein
VQKSTFFFHGLLPIRVSILIVENTPGTHRKINEITVFPLCVIENFCEWKKFFLKKTAYAIFAYAAGTMSHSQFRPFMHGT